MSRTIMTVNGPIDPTDLGICLAHEHLASDGSMMSQPPEDPERAELYHSAVRPEQAHLLSRDPTAVLANAILEYEEVVEDLAGYHDLGGRSIIEVTPDGMGRDPARLRRISDAAGVHIVAGSAQYVAALQPGWVREASVEKLAEWFRAEVRDGIDGSGVRPGVLGELGVSFRLEPSEATVLRAAARVQSETGIAISLHIPTTVAPEALDVLEAEGADLTRVVVGHCDILLDGQHTHDLHCQLAERGCFLGFDTFGGETRFSPMPLTPVPMWLSGDGPRMKALMALIESGHSGRLLLSQDTCMRMHLGKYGGRGYGYLLRTIVPDLLSFGVAQADVDRMLIENPRRLLAF